MTCIVGIEHEGTVYVGGDSAAVDADTLEICRRADEKVFSLSDMVVGFCGSFRTGQLLRYALSPPDQKIGQDDMAYMVTDFIDSVRTMQKEHGVLKKDNELEQQESQFIVAYNGKLYVIEDDFQVSRPVENYVAIGTGASVALGALYATKELNMVPEDRVKLALKASVEYCAGVRAPFHIVKLEPEKEE